jgi:disulfide bond formation protein DsbB
MHDVYEAIMDCGWAAWLCVLIAFPAFVAGVLALVLALKARAAAGVLGGLAIALGVFGVGTGLMGRQWGISRVMGATSSAALDPSQRDRIRALGMQEAGQCVKIGGFTGGLPILLGLSAIVLGTSARKKSAEPGA